MLGISHEVGAAPAFYAGRVAGHVTPETLEDLGFDATFDELHIKVADPTLDQDGIRAVADEVSTRIERAGIPVFGSYVPVPGRHPANDLLQGFFLVLGFIGALALIVSGFLVVNTVSAILAQQTRQIGIMKAIGARNGQIAGLYLVLVLAYAVLALAVALPLGAHRRLRLRPVHRGPRQLRHRRGLDPARGHRARGRHRARRPAARRARPDLPRRPDHRARGAGLDRASRTASATAGSTACCATSAACRARRCSRSATRSAARAGWS